MTDITFASNRTLAHLEELTIELRNARNALHFIEVRHCHGPAPDSTWELLRASRASLNAACREIETMMHSKAWQ